MKRPALRFKRYDGEWVNKTLADLARVYDGVHHTPDYKTSGVMFLSVEDIVTLKSNKYISEDDFERDYKVYPEIGDVLMTRIGVIGATNVVRTTEKIAYYVSLALLKPNHIDSDFLSNLIRSPAFQKGLMNRSLLTAVPQKINKNEIGKVDAVCASDRAEQIAIGKFFTELDSLIEGMRVKLDKLKKLKLACLGKMFPKKGARVPEVRFKGFSGDWVESRFDELYTKVTEKNDFTYDTDRIISVANMYFKNDAYITDRNYLLTYNVFKTGDIAFEGNKSKNFSHGRFVENTIGDGIISHVFDVFRPKVEYDLLYWKYAINNERVMRDVLIRCTKQSTMMTNLVASDFLKQKILYPSVPEQQKIGAFFQNIDNLINLQQQELDKLSNIKSACLSKMFA